MMELYLIKSLSENNYFKNLYILKDLIALSRLHKKNSISLIERIVQSFLWEILNFFSFLLWLLILYSLKINM